MHHDRADDGVVAVAVRRADAFARMQQAPVFGVERRHLFEHFPRAAGFLPRLADLGVGQLQRKPAHQRPGRIVEFDRRGQPLGGEHRPLPDEKRGVGRHRTMGDGRRGPHEVGQIGQGIDLRLRFAQLQLQVPPLVGHLGRVARLDQLAMRAIGGVEQRRIAHERGHHEGEEQRHESKRLRRLGEPRAIPSEAPGRHHREPHNQEGGKHGRTFPGRRDDADDQQGGSRPQNRNPGTHPPVVTGHHPARRGEPEDQDRQRHQGRMQHHQTHHHREACRIEGMQRKLQDVER